MAHVYVDSNAVGAGTGANWANAYTTLAAALSAKAAGDQFWIAHNHAETQATQIILNPPGTSASPNTIMCVNSAGSVPPVSADLRTTATITTTGFSAILSQSGYAYWYGITFNCGSGAVNSAINFANGNAASTLRFDSCVFAKNGTSSTNSAIIFGGTGTVGIDVELVNCKMSFGSPDDSISLRSCNFLWRDTASAIAGAAIPTTLIGPSGAAGQAILKNLDLSALGSGATIVGGPISPKKVLLEDCRFGSAVVVASTPTAKGSAEVVSIRSDSAGAAYRSEKFSYTGTLTTETTLVRTGGASDGVTPLSHKMSTTANSKWYLPFESIPICVFNDAVAADATATIEGIWNASALPNNDEAWFDVSYMGSASSPLGTLKSGTKADFLASGSALTASTEAWDSLVSSRANSTAYTVGQMVKVASNPGRVFFCTTAGTTAGSEPAGFAAAVDGGSVTDNTAVFRAGVRFKQTVTLTSPQPQLAGAVYIHPKVAKASSTVWTDPLVTLA